MRIRCYQKIVDKYDRTPILSLLPLAMRMAGPREAMLHALIRANYGCTHFVVGRDHAGPSTKKKDGSNYFEPFAAQELLDKFQDKLPIKILKSEFIVHVKEENKYYQLSKVPEGTTVNHISGTKLRELLKTGQPVPEWFSFPEVVEELKKAYPLTSKQGFCIYFTGLSGSGKSTLANALKTKLEQLTYRKVSLLDGDTIRLYLSKGLGFSKEDRSTNVRRIGYVASEIVKHGGVCLVANIAPYQADRDHNRALISQYGGYMDCHVETSLSICEERDVKGLYALARQGKIKEFTGISDPYETPMNAEFVINSVGDINDLLYPIISNLNQNGYIDSTDE